MHPHEKIIHVERLWDKVRIMVKANKVTRVLSQLPNEPFEDKIRRRLGLEKEEEENVAISKYIFFKYDPGYLSWQLIMAMPTIYTMIVYPMIWVWPTLQNDQILWIWTIEIMWTFDFFLSFFRADNLDKSVYDSSIRYLSGKFFFDFLALWPGIFTGQLEALCLLKVSRIVHFDRFMMPVDFIGKVMIKGYENGNKEYLLWYLGSNVLATHFMACLWLALGMKETYNDCYG